MHLSLSLTLPLLLLLLLLGGASAGIFEGGDIVNLTPQSFKSMLAADELYIVAFIAPW